MDNTSLCFFCLSFHSSSWYCTSYHYYYSLFAVYQCPKHYFSSSSHKQPATLFGLSSFVMPRCVFYYRDGLIWARYSVKSSVISLRTFFSIRKWWYYLYRISLPLSWSLCSSDSIVLSWLFLPARFASWICS